MTSRHTNPAIYAGLAGAVAFAAPTYAHAVEAYGNVPLSQTGIAFVSGCVGGALVASGVSLVMERIMVARQERAEAENMFVAHARHSSDAQIAAVAEAAAAKAVSYGRHSAADHAVRAWEKTGAIRVQDAPTPKHAAHAKAAPSETDQWIALATSSSVASTPATNDYADVAESYVQKITLAERMSQRAKGVANVLAERINANKMEGLPVIARADGSVADMGDSWWDSVFDDDFVVGAQNTKSQAQAQNIQPQAQVEPKTFSASQYVSNPQPVAVSQPQASMQQVSQTQVQAQPQTAQTQGVVNAKSSDDQAENRWSDKQQDLWAIALAALDDRFEEQIALGPDSMNNTFVDMVGDADTIDEPDGLEPDTMFMTFKPTAGHPEVQDTTSYVDLLIDQEFAHNSSASARKSVRGVLRNYLTVVDGGTGTIAPRHAAPSHMVAAQAL